MKESKDMKKININVPVELLAQIDDEADRKHQTRTAFIVNACQDRLQADAFLRKSPDIQQKLNELNDALSEIAKNQDKDFAGVFGQERIEL